MGTYSTEMLELFPSADLCVGMPLVGPFCSELDCEIPTWADQGMAQGNTKAPFPWWVNQRCICKGLSKGPAFIILHGCVLWGPQEAVSSPSE